MHAFRIMTALVAALAPATLVAQLEITSAPHAGRVDPHSTLSFTALVPKPASDTTTHKLRCTTSDCGYSSQKPLTAADMGGQLLLTFKSFTIPSTAKAGTAFCFDVYVPGTHVANPYGGTLTIIKDHVVTSACTKVSTPYINAGASEQGGAAATATQAASPRLPNMPRTASVSRSGSDGTAGAARSGPGGRADLVIAFVKAPVAKWTVRNVGTASSPATQVEFRRLGVVESKMQHVGGLEPGAVAEITVTPELDMFLVNSTAEVDPAKQIDEADETNNRWESKESR